MITKDLSSVFQGKSVLINAVLQSSATFFFLFLKVILNTWIEIALFFFRKASLKMFMYTHP